MGFFDDFASEIEKFLKGKPEMAVKLRSCKNCSFYKRNYCTQTTPPTKILSEYYAQGCIYYGTEQVTTGLMTKTERESYASLLDRIKLIDLITKVSEVSLIDAITLIDKITEITNIKNVESIDLIDVISTIEVIQNIQKVTSANIRNAPRLVDAGFESNSIDFAWRDSVNTEIRTAYKFSGVYGARVYTQNGYLGQILEVPVQCKYVIGLSVMARNEKPFLSEDFTFRAIYTDGTVTDHVFSANKTYTGFDMTPHLDTDKILMGINLICTGTNKLWIDNAVLLDYSPIDIMAQSVGNLLVDLKAQSVDLDIKTSGGANIVIDKLTQTAYLEDRRTLSNNGESASWHYWTGNNRASKFFPRGARGFIEVIRVYCKDDGVAGGTITVYLSPQIGMGYVASATITVGAGVGADWRFASFNRMWNYDSMFIFIVCSSSDIKVAYDTVEYYDFFDSDDVGATWTHGNSRLWISAVMKAMTVGDLPVSGTINTIEIPNESDERLYTVDTLGDLTEKTIKEIDGAGHVEYLDFLVEAETNSHHTVCKVYCDGKPAYAWAFSGLNGRGFVATTDKIAVLLYAVDGFCYVHTALDFSFKRKLKITMQNALTANQTVQVEGLVNLIK